MNNNFDLKTAKSFLLTENVVNEAKLTIQQLAKLKPGSKVTYLGKDVDGFKNGEQYEVSRVESSSTLQPTITVKNNDGKKLRTSNLSENNQGLNQTVSEGYQEQGFESEDEMEDYYNDSDFLDENEELDEMAKIAGDLKSSIEAVLAANPDLEGLALKKAIKGDSAVINALDGEDLYDNQLNKFISLSKGEREVGQRGRKADPNKPAAAPKAEKSPKIKITNPKAAAVPAAASTKLADLAPASVFGGGEEDEEDVAAEKQAIAAAKGGKRLGSAAEKLAQVTKEMKALIPAYQAAKGTPEAAAITAQLKDLTAEKKALEAKVFK